jgi:hypothetical protein
MYISKHVICTVDCYVFMYQHSQGIMWCTFSFVPQLLSSSWLISQYPHIYLMSLDCCNDRFLKHHQSLTVVWCYQLSEHILLMSTHSEIELLHKSFTIYDPPQVLVWTLSRHPHWIHRRKVPTMAVNLPPHAMLGVDGVRCRTSIDFKLQQLLVPTMRLSGHRWHSSGGCLAGIVHRT